MNKKIPVAILLLFGCYCTRADLKELQLKSREYLPPLENQQGNGYLPPPTKQKDEKPDNKEQLTNLKTNLDYQYNQPKVIDEPLPMEVDYIQPLGIDFVSGKYKPIFKGALIFGLFFNENEAQALRDELLAPTNNVANVYGKKTRSQSDEMFSPAESTNKNPDDIYIVPISFYDMMKRYILFNYDDDIELSGSAPEVIFKPGDDISFSEDTTVIDNYEHMFSAEELKSNSKNAELKLKTTTTPPPLEPVTNANEAHSAEGAKHLTFHTESESNKTDGHGYIYDKPKIPFTF